MFCKFCGETLDPTQTKCRRCGREVPAASDCGGYHDVIKDLNKRGITDPQNPPQVYVTQKAPESKIWVATAICAVLLIAVLLLQFVLIKKVDGLRAVVDEFEPYECTAATDDSGEETTEDQDSETTLDEESKEKEDSKEEDSKEEKDSIKIDIPDSPFPGENTDEGPDEKLD